jgi:Tat protein secretion system quality control protein TatD with DNase activity
MGYYIRQVNRQMYDLSLTRMLSTSVNGCSMKTEAQLEMIKMIPLEKLLLETGTQAPPPPHGIAVL